MRICDNKTIAKEDDILMDIDAIILLIKKTVANTLSRSFLFLMRIKIASLMFFTFIRQYLKQ